MIKMIAMDFDWTLIDHSSGKPAVLPELMKWFSEFIKDGNHARKHIFTA